MSRKGFVAGLLCGIALGWASQKIITENRTFSSEEILNKVKNSVETSGRVIGSWIMAKPETIERDSIPHQVYRGGITQLEGENENHFEFLADAKTGKILEWSKI